MQTLADHPSTRLAKTKMFSEQLIVKRTTPTTWGPAQSRGKPLDMSINEWVDITGNEIIAVTAPSMHIQWLDQEHTTRLIVAAVMVTYIPAVPIPTTPPQIRRTLPKIEGMPATK